MILSLTIKYWKFTHIIRVQSSLRQFGVCQILTQADEHQKYFKSNHNYQLVSSYIVSVFSQVKVHTSQGILHFCWALVHDIFRESSLVAFPRISLRQYNKSICFSPFLLSLSYAIVISYGFRQPSLIPRDLSLVNRWTLLDLGHSGLSPALSSHKSSWME